MNQPDEQQPADREAMGLGQIHEVHEEDISEATELQQHQQAMQYPPGQEAIGNQLELASMISEANSVMGQSPVRSSRPIRSRQKGRIEK